MIKKYLNEKVLYCSNERILSYKRGILYIRVNNSEFTIKKKIRIGTILDMIPSVSRILRKEPRCAVGLGNDCVLVSYNGGILKIDLSRESIELEHRFKEGMSNALSFCVGADDEILYGEYINKSEDIIDIYKRDIKGEWIKVYSFKNCIKHIHNIIFDSYRNQYIILTGDKDSEVGIWVSDIEFKRVRKLYGDNQMFRACIFLVNEDGAFYATDSPSYKNYIYYIANRNGEWEYPQKIIEIAGSCIYGTKINDKSYFSTTIEPMENLALIPYLFTRKRGDGIKDCYSRLYSVDENKEVKELFKSKKDFLPMGLCGFGNISFPYNCTDKVIFNTQGLKSGHLKSYEYIA